VKHFAAAAFWRHYRRLPAAIRHRADRSFDLLKADPAHPSLHFKQAGRYWSVRVGRKYRALAVQQPEGLIWFWIGPHAEYDRLLQS
jgi:hypothetical protein